MADVTLVTTSKGRLSSLKKTLKTMVDTGYPVVVVDYDCPDKTADWVVSCADLNAVHLVKATNRTLFNHSAARNLGLAAVKTEWVLFIDADVAVVDIERFQTFVTSLPQRPVIYTHKQPCGCLMGTALVKRDTANSVHGYDTIINAYGAGYDDLEFYQRILRIRCASDHFPTQHPLFQHFEHSGRTTYCEIKDRIMSDRLTSFYYAVKHDVLRLYSPETTPELPYEYRQKLMDGCYQAFKALTGNEPSVKVDVTLPSIEFPNATFERVATYTLKFKGNRSELSSHIA